MAHHLRQVNDQHHRQPRGSQKGAVMVQEWWWWGVLRVAFLQVWVPHKNHQSSWWGLGTPVKMQTQGWQSGILGGVQKATLLPKSLGGSHACYRLRRSSSQRSPSLPLLVNMKAFHSWVLTWCRAPFLNSPADSSKFLALCNFPDFYNWPAKNDNLSPVSFHILFLLFSLIVWVHTSNRRLNSSR